MKSNQSKFARPIRREKESSGTLDDQTTTQSKVKIKFINISMKGKFKHRNVYPTVEKTNFDDKIESIRFCRGVWKLYSCLYMLSSQLVAMHVKRWKSENFTDKKSLWNVDNEHTKRVKFSTQLPSTTTTSSPGDFSLWLMAKFSLPRTHS